MKRGGIIISGRFYCDDASKYKGYTIYDVEKFDKKKEEFEPSSIDEYLVDNTDCKMTGEEVVKMLDDLLEEVEWWKGNACSTSSENSMLWHELERCVQKGYATSDAFNKYKENLFGKFL